MESKSLKISNKLARELYPSAVPDLKDILEVTFGKSFFSQKITDRIKSFEDACEALGIQPTEVTCSYDNADDVAYKQLKVVIAALNEGWTPDWNNDDEQKWYPWFYMDGRFRLDYVGYFYASSFVGSRLCFRTREVAEYAAKQFEDLYKQFFTL
jgi:hypothetical protein